ncbi:DUF2637 domain-containing protein [Streptomyces bauhiniae]|uniref:DUF2637 domain-containing protein n=1 Tax=Streptomyces bauhiniae TaxID=2340725 RepID=UPI0033A7793E
MSATQGTPLQPLTHTQKLLTGIVISAVLTIAALGFIGSYSAVTHLALRKGFGEFAHAFPIAVDAGIIAFLALDLLLTWRRIAFPLLRYSAWGLTAATIAFNAVAAWPDPVGVSMHGVIPVLFVIAVEAARHAVGRIADITADKHLEGPPAARWLLNPAGTFVLWRRQRLWGIRTWDAVLGLERERRIFKGKLRKQYGRGWRWSATADQLLILHLATKDGLSITEALALPEKEAEKQRLEHERIVREQQEAEDKRRREMEADARERQRLEDELARQAEADRREAERLALELEEQRVEAARRRRIADAEAAAQLAEIARRQQEADAETERRRNQEQLEHARRVAEEQQRAAAAARQVRENQEAAARAAAEKEAASRRAFEVMQRAASASASASASAVPATRSASPATANTAASQTANAPTTPASAKTASPAASSASTVDIQQVVDVYQLLEQQDGKAPSDAKLGQAIGVSRSRAQQLRTAAIDAGHTELAKPMRLAS